MSHLSRIKTRIAEKDLLISALEDLGYRVEEGVFSIKAIGGNRTEVELRAKGKLLSADIGFRKSGETYEIITDWYGVRGLKEKEFVDQLNQRYAYHATRVKLEAQGFDLVNEITENGQIRLVLRRMA